MFDLVTYGSEKIQLFILLLMRIGGLLVAGPIFSHKAIPRKIVVSFSLGLAIVILPIFINTKLPPVDGMIDLLALCFREIVVGLIIGLVFSFIFLSIRLAGSIVAYQIGFAMANIMDPNSASPVSVIGEFWVMIATLIFLVINGHHIMITGLVDSFRVIPLGSGLPSGEVGVWMIKYASFVFVLAIKFAAPVIMTIFLVEVSMGILARTMPQMNIFIVGYPIKIFAGLFLIGSSLPVFAYVLRKVTANLDSELNYLMNLYNVSGAV